MHRSIWRITALLALLYTPIAAAEQPVDVVKKSLPLADVKTRIPCEFFQPDFPQGDSNYHSLAAASDGKLYFSIDTHNSDYACRFYSFDPASDTVTQIAALDAPVGEDAREEISQGKIHVPFYEHKGKLYFSTHLSFYADGLPGYDGKGKRLYQGGHFMSYDLKTGDFEDLAQILPDEGLITMILDKDREVLYGLSWPSALLISYELKTGDLHSWGAVQGRGEWGHLPFEWDRVCRTLALEPNGNLYGSTMDGQIWRFQPGLHPRPFQYIDGLDLSRLVFSQSAAETNKGAFQYNWRVLEWNPTTQSFFGIQWETTALFEFAPEKEYLRALCDFRHDAYKGMPRNPEISQLGFLLTPDNNTILYLANGPAATIPGRPDVQSSIYLLSYDIAKGTMTNHGLVVGKDNRRPFFTESLAIGADGHLYSVAWTEVIDPARRAAIAKARAFGPEETERMVYEVQLIRLPKWEKFVK